MITPDDWICHICRRPRAEHRDTVWCPPRHETQFTRWTPKFVGMLRIKNESRWIEEVIKALRPLCAHVFVLDDHSTDDTVEIVQRLPYTTVWSSPFTDFDESRDKNYQYDEILRVCEPAWMVCIDGDEVLQHDGADRIHEYVAANPTLSAFALRILYLWNDPDTVRVDGVYGNFYRPSVFRPFNPSFRFQTTNWPGNLHCSSVPQELIHGFGKCPVALKHYGYMEKEKRLAKYAWYTRVDPNNDREDYYRHMVQGDVPEIPSDSLLKHAGPLRLRPYSSVVA